MNETSLRNYSVNINYSTYFSSISNDTKILECFRIKFICCNERINKCEIDG